MPNSSSDIQIIRFFYDGSEGASPSRRSRLFQNRMAEGLLHFQILIFWSLRNDSITYFWLEKRQLNNLWP